MNYGRMKTSSSDFFSLWTKVCKEYGNLILQLYKLVHAPSGSYLPWMFEHSNGTLLVVYLRKWWKVTTRATKAPFAARLGEPSRLSLLSLLSLLSRLSRPSRPTTLIYNYCLFHCVIVYYKYTSTSGSSQVIFAPRGGGVELLCAVANPRHARQFLGSFV